MTRAEHARQALISLMWGLEDLPVSLTIADSSGAKPAASLAEVLLVPGIGQNAAKVA